MNERIRQEIDSQIRGNLAGLINAGVMKQVLLDMVSAIEKGTVVEIYTSGESDYTATVDYQDWDDYQVFAIDDELVWKVAGDIDEGYRFETATYTYRFDGAGYIRNTKETSEGGSGGTSDYTQLTNKPSINGVELNGNKTTADLNINIPTKTSDLTNDSGFINAETEPAFNSSPAKNITNGDITNWNGKQDTLVSGQNIKTINNQSILGGGNIEMQGGGGGGTTDYNALVNKPSINGQELVGDITVSGGAIQQKNLEEITLTDYVQGYVSSTEKVVSTTSGSRTYYRPVTKGERFVGVFVPNPDTYSNNMTGVMGFSASIPKVGTQLTHVLFLYSHHSLSVHTACPLREEFIAPADGYLCTYAPPSSMTYKVFKVNEDYSVAAYDTYIEEDILFKAQHGQANSPDGWASKSYLLHEGVNYKVVYRAMANQGYSSYTIYDASDNVLYSTNDSALSAQEEHVMEDLTVPAGAHRIEFKYFIKWNSTDGVLYHGNIDEGMAALMKPLLDDGSMPINDIVYCVSRIKRDQIPYNYNSATHYDFTEDVWSAWAVRFPSGWQNSGKQTPLFAFLHGTGGFVTADRITYTTAYGTRMADLLYDNGIAMFDVNGFGVTFTRNAFTKHWGCPAAIATMKKAYTVLTERLNCRKGMVVGCVSMGGALAKSYAMTYPQDCEALAMCAPSEIGIKLRNDLDEMPFCWGFPSSDPDPNYILGYTPLAMPKIIKEITIGETTEKIICEKDSWTGDELKTLEVYCPFPVQTVIWQGDADTNVPISYNRAFVRAARNAGSNVKLREIPDYPHNISDYYDEVVGYAKSILKV